MSKGQKIAISLGAILFVICLVIDIWYGYILLFGKEKVVSKTFNVSTLTLADGTTQNIIEVEYFSNKNNSGYEAFEIKYTYFMDETKENSYSQGFQYIADKSHPIDFGAVAGDVLFKEKKPFRTEGALFWKDKYYNCQVPSAPSDLISCYNYMYNGVEYVKSTNPIDEDSYFKIQIGEDLYLMQFKGANKYDKQGKLIENTPINSDNFCGSSIKLGDFGADAIYRYHYVYDAHYFSRLLYESVKTFTLGTNDDVVFEWGNLFNYYKFDKESGKYSENRTNYDESIKIQADIKSYYSIRVKTHEYGLSNAKDSLFGSVLGNRNFSLNGDYSSGDYFIGRTIVDCDISSFNFVTVDENNVALKLNNAFTNYYIPYKDSIVLSVVIDLDLLESLGYTFVGFTADNGLDKFNIYKCYSTSQGEVVEDYTSELKVVEYD